MEKIKNINETIANLSAPKFICLMVLALILALLITYPIYTIFPINYPEGYLEKNYSLENINIWYRLFRAVIYAPIIETFLFQSIPIGITVDIIRKHKNAPYEIPILTPVLVSAFLFGMAHYFSYWNSIGKFATTFVDGLIFGYAYVISLSIEDKPYWKTVAIHGLANLVFWLPTILAKIGIVPYNI